MRSTGFIIKKTVVKRNVQFFLFVAPVIIGFLLFTAYPLFRSLYLSFTDAKLIQSADNPANWIGFDNYIKIFTVDMTLYFGPSLLYSLLYAVISVPLSMGISLGLALILNKKTLRFNGFFRVVFYLPSILPSVAMSIMFRWLFTPGADGFINSVLRSIGVANPPMWLGASSGMLGFFVIVFMSLWGFGGKMIIFLAALKGVPKDYYEAASIEGAGKWTMFAKITLPSISPIFFYNLFTSIVGAIQIFTESLIVGGATKQTTFLVLYIYNTAYTGVNPNLGYASAMAWVLFAVISVFTIGLFRFNKSFVHYEN